MCAAAGFVAHREPWADIHKAVEGEWVRRKALASATLDSMGAAHESAFVSEGRGEGMADLGRRSCAPPWPDASLPPPPPTGTGHREVLGMPLHRHRGAGFVCAGRGCLGPVRRWCRGRTSGRRAPCAARKAGPSRARHRVGPTTRTIPGPRRRENADIAGRAWGMEARAARREARAARERASGGRPCA